MSNTKKGTLIVFEGMDFSGKTTQRRLVAQRLRDEGFDVVETREPGGTPAAESMRSVLHDKSTPMTPLAELYLCQAARTDHLTKVIIPAIERGAIVLCDRFYPSTFAWQVYPYAATPEFESLLQAFGESLSVILRDLAALAQIYIDVPKEVRQVRHTEEGDRNSFDARPESFMDMVEEGYAAIIQNEELVVVNGNQAEAEVTDEIMGIIRETLFEQGRHEEAVAASAELQAEAEAKQPETPEAPQYPEDFNEFIEQALTRQMAQLKAMLPPKEFAEWELYIRSKAPVLKTEVEAKGITGPELYQQMEHGINQILGVAYHREVGNQMLQEVRAQLGTQH